MSKSIQQLREQRDAYAKAARKVLDEYEDKTWDDAAQSKYDEQVHKIDAVDRQIKAVEKQLEIDGEAIRNDEAKRTADRHGISEDEAHHGIQLRKDAMRNWVLGGERALTEEQREYVNNNNSRAQKVWGAQTVGTNTEGGYLAPDEQSSNLLVALKAYGGVREAANVLTTDHGRDIPMPTTDPTAEEGELLAESATAADLDTSFGIVTIGAYKYSSKTVPITIELLMDSLIDVEDHVNGILGMRLGRITNKNFTTGDNVNKPNGIITAAALGKTGLVGQTGSIIYDDLIDLEHSVDPAYRKQKGDCRYMFHDDSLKVLKKLKDSQGRPLWVPGLTSGEPDTLNSYGYIINQEMATMAANAKSVAFGNFKYYTIRDVAAVQFMRFNDSAYAKKGQIGLLAFSRHDGELMAANNDAIKYYQNSAT